MSTYVVVAAPLAATGCVDLQTGAVTVPVEGVVIPGRTDSILVGSPATINGSFEAFTVDQGDIGAALPPVAGACDERVDPARSNLELQ